GESCSSPAQRMFPDPTRSTSRRLRVASSRRMSGTIWCDSEPAGADAPCGTRVAAAEFRSSSGRVTGKSQQQGDAVMDQRTSTGVSSRRDRIRNLGFDPEQLTPYEQAELLELQVYLSSATSDAAVVTDRRRESTSSRSEGR